ncbi:Scavenger receptor cysteine-rich type 1 M130 [Paramuricea clavata]|nr:Scavenger receptor cysteine-rich type 1 M130 [Paramuricea clavata]
MTDELTAAELQPGQIFDHIELENSNCSTVLNNEDSSRLSEGNVLAAKKLKGNLKWQGDYNELCQFVDDLQLQPGSWSTPGGNCKLFENGEVAIRWYSNTRTITLKGERAAEVKDKIIKLNQELGSEVMQQSSNYAKNLHADLETTISHLHTGSQHDNLKTNVTSKTDSEMNQLRSKLDNFTEIVNRKLEVLADEVYAIKENKPYSILVLEDVNNELKKEKIELIRKNEELEKKYLNLYQSTSVLRAKVTDLENEKSSLTTALRLVHQDNDLLSKRLNDPKTHCGNTLAAVTYPQDDLPDKAETRDGPSTSVEKGNHEASMTTELMVTTRNQYEALTNRVSDTDDNANSSVQLIHEKTITQQESNHPNIHNKEEVRNVKKRGEKKGNPSQQHRSPSSSNSTSLKNAVENNNPVTIIIGDSMIKGLRPDKISKSVKHKAQVKSFPGTTVEDLTDYIKPSLKRKPKNIIVHVGTNDLKMKSAKDVAKSIDKLCKSIKLDQPQTSISVSEIIHREDNQELKEKALAVNKELVRYSEQKKFYLIKNENIDKNKLNLYGLHLNKQGSAVLAKNIVTHINCLKYL